MMQKKLIKYGWDVPWPAYLVEHVREMEKQPFDGIMIQLGRDAYAPEGEEFGRASLMNWGERFTLGGRGDYSHVFLTKEFDERIFAADMEALAKIKWNKFTDNFVMVYSGSDMDWFSDEDWATDGWVLRNVGLCARAARIGRCVGVCFDPESYTGRDPWGYG